MNAQDKGQNLCAWNIEVPISTVLLLMLVMHGDAWKYYLVH